MRIPDSLFPIINFVVSFLLRSPAHGFVSDSLMIIHFRGRKSGKNFATPVRYNRIDGSVQCFTAEANKWWRNIRDGEETELLISGRLEKYVAKLVTGQSETIRMGVESLLAKYPADAPYYEIRLNRDKTLNEQDLERALQQTVMVEFKPTR